MAAAGDIGEAAEAAATAKNRRTINDFLGEGDDGESSPPSPETPPRLRLPRFTCARIRFGRLGRKRGAGRKELPAAAVAERSAGASSSDSPSAPAAGSAGSVPVAVAAQTGLGLSMLLLLARTCVELNRMAEVRAQMEALLQEIRDEASRVKGAADADHVHAAATPKTCTDNNLGSSSTTTASSSCVSGTSTNNCLEDTGCDEDVGKRVASGDLARAAAGTDELLEAELDAAEHAPRQPPEWKCDSDQETPECSMHSSSDSDDDEEFIELEGGWFGRGGGGGGVGDRDGGGDAGEEDGSASSRERDEGGVSAVELERRLHELRHRRDRERIAALESALRRAERRLTEKEMEARLWQDTAALALGQPPATGRDGQ
ncbi:unnamed protein product [Urochloa decumbens]|uniref:Protein POLAR LOCALIZATION DURING ASYMMETRIC DIVISION AND REDISTRIBUTION n=1 Tax=Urochloa decumbens TaxID=240449 RepID=A0ABC9ENA4_9POAL